MNPFGQVFFYILILVATSEVKSADFIYGGEARRVCKAYKRVCSDGKVCALQTIDWPQSMKFPVCVYRKQKLVKSHVCRKAPQPGRCSAKFTRWYYNIHMQACSWFIYSGCGGNKNNFRTFEECEKTCTSSDDVISRMKKNIDDSIENDANENDGRVHTRNESGDTNDGRRIPVTAPAPEIIDFTDDVTATLSLEKDGSIDDNEDLDDENEEENVDNKDEEEEWEEEEDEIAANLAKKLKKQEKRRKRKLERERRRMEKLIRRREREMRKKKKKKKERSGLNSRNSEKSLGADVISENSEKQNGGFRNNLAPTHIRRQKYFNDIVQRQNQDHQHQQNQELIKIQRHQQVETRQAKDEGKSKKLKIKHTRQLTPLELGPYYKSGSSPSEVEKDSSFTPLDPFSKLGRYRVRKWLIDDRFGLRKGGRKRGRKMRRGRRYERRRRRRRRRRIRRIDNLKSINNRMNGNRKKQKNTHHNNEDKINDNNDKQRKRSDESSKNKNRLSTNDDNNEDESNLDLFHVLEK